MEKLIDDIREKLVEKLDDENSLFRWKFELFEMIDELSNLKIEKKRDKIKTTSLDPSDWSKTNRIAHEILDSSLEFLRYRRDQPVWRPIPDEIRSSIENDPLPNESESLTKIHQNILKNVVPFSRGNTHPRFWGWVMGEGTIGGVLAELIAATLNINTGGCTHSGVFIERVVLQWMREIFRFPTSYPGGILVSGTSMATIICLATARRKYLIDVRKNGIFNSNRLIIYASTEVHICVTKAAELLGFGTESIHLISVDEQFRIKIDELRKTIEEDRRKGFLPFCLVGNAGTVNIGAFDDLRTLSIVAQEENLWFHVDGAFGSLIILDPERQHFVDGIDQADSLAFDFHKWLHCPYDAGCVLIRNGQHLIDCFSVHQSYLADTERGCAGDKPWFCDLGTELSRTFRALKVWVTLKEQGFRRLGEKIAENCQQAKYLVTLLEKTPELIRIVRPVNLNIVNFRFEPENLRKFGDEFLDQFNNELLSDLQISGIAVASTTKFNGRLFIRVCIVSHRCTFEDFDLFVEHLHAAYQRRLSSLPDSS